MLNNKQSSKALLVMFMFVILVFSLLAVRLEQNDKKFGEQQYRACVVRNINVTRLNTFNEGMIRIEKHNPFMRTSPETVRDRIKLYQGAILDHVQCEGMK